MKGEVQFTIAFEVTTEELDLLRQIVAHYRQTHPSSSAAAVSKLAEQIQELSERANTVARLLDNNSPSPQVTGPSVLMERSPSAPAPLPFPFSEFDGPDA
jgi:hypothetical protein